MSPDTLRIIKQQAEHRIAREAEQEQGEKRWLEALSAVPFDAVPPYTGAGMAEMGEPDEEDDEPELRSTIAPVKDSSMIGNSGYERNARDFYPTPANVTDALCRSILAHRLGSVCDIVWEPACGDGQMVDVLKKHFAGVIASDIMPLEGSGGFEADFLTSTPKQKFDSIITNPPFGTMINKFMARGLHHLRKPGGSCRLFALVARHELDTGIKRSKFFGNCPEFAAKIILTWRPRWIAESTGSPRHAYAVYVWCRGDQRIDGPRIYYGNKR